MPPLYLLHYAKVKYSICHFSLCFIDMESYCVYVSMTFFFPSMLLLRFNYIDTAIIHAFSCYMLIYCVKVLSTA